MTFWDFANAHPVWTFVYVFLLCCLAEVAIKVCSKTLVRIVDTRRGKPDA